MDVAIIDYKMSNLHSVQAACKQVGIDSVITSDRETILNAKAAILPGVGAFGEAMSHLKELKLDDCIHAFIEMKKPFVGICLGMQLLFEKSEEFGYHKGLGLVKGEVRKFEYFEDEKHKYPVPQIGWNRIIQNGTTWEDTLLKDNSSNDFMYFVHSYYVVPFQAGVGVANTVYGLTKYCSAIAFENIFASQFHPEKSGTIGLKIYCNLKKILKEKE